MDAKHRHLIAKIVSKHGNSKLKGDTGERFAKAWFDRKGIEYYYFPQTPETMPFSLKKICGKRPDFMIWYEPDSLVIYVDVKFLRTRHCTEFILEEVELNKYCAFRKWAQVECGDNGDRDILFMLYPQEHSGSCFTFIHLDEVLDAPLVSIKGKSARKVLLAGRQDLWFNQEAGESDT